MTFKMSCFQTKFSYGPTLMTFKNSKNHVIFDRKYSPNSCLYFLFSWFLSSWDQWAVNEWTVKLQQSSNFPKFVSEQTWYINLERKIKSKFMVKTFQSNSLGNFFKCDKFCSRTSKYWNFPPFFCLETKSWEKSKSWQTNKFLAYSNNFLLSADF